MAIRHSDQNFLHSQMPRLEDAITALKAEEDAQALRQGEEITSILGYSPILQGLMNLQDDIVLRLLRQGEYHFNLFVRQAPGSRDLTVFGRRVLTAQRRCLHEKTRVFNTDNIENPTVYLKMDPDGEWCVTRCTRCDKLLDKIAVADIEQEAQAG